MKYIEIRIPTLILLENLEYVTKGMYVYSNVDRNHVFPGCFGYINFVFFKEDNFLDIKKIRGVIDDFLVLLNLFQMSFCNLSLTTNTVHWKKLSWKETSSFQDVLNKIIPFKGNELSINLKRISIVSLIRFKSEVEMDFTQIFRYYLTLPSNNFEKNTIQLFAFSVNQRYSFNSYNNDYIRISLLFTVYERLQFIYKNLYKKMTYNYSSEKKKQKRLEIYAKIMFGFEEEKFSDIICTMKKVRDKFYHFGAKSIDINELLEGRKTVNWTDDLNDFEGRGLGISVFESALMILLVKRLLFSMFTSVITRIIEK